MRTFLVHLADDDDHRERLATALLLAKPLGGHIVALFLTTPARLPAGAVGRATSAGYLAEATARARAVCASLRDEFESQCAEAGVTFSWVEEEGDHVERLVRHSHVADLAILTQSLDETFEDHFRMHTPEALTLAVGCPVLLLPRGWTAKPFGTRVMIAWKATREAVRAVRNALPILQAADAVTIVQVKPRGEPEVPPSEVADYLSRHGVNATGVTIDSADNAGAALLDKARDMDADLVVMGAFGHSKVVEVLLGGVSRHVFEHTTLPLFTSH